AIEADFGRELRGRNRSRISTGASHPALRGNLRCSRRSVDFAKLLSVDRTAYHAFGRLVISRCIARIGEVPYTSSGVVSPATLALLQARQGDSGATAESRTTCLNSKNLVCIEISQSKP